MWLLLFTNFVIFNFVSSAVQSPNCTVEHTSSVAWSVDCSNLNLSNLPKHLLDHPIVNITFTNNKLKNVTFKNWPNLNYINIAENEIEIIDKFMFQGLSKLKELNISFNLLQNIRPEDFKEISNLDILDLSGNKILGRNSDNLFKAVNSTLYGGLKRLTLRSLNITNVPEFIFKHSFELKYLDLRNNNLQDLPKFPSTLEYLDISQNDLSELKLHTFFDLHHLKTLIVEDNKNLRTINADAFHFLRNLTTLSLKGSSQLDYLPNTLFMHVPLKSLSLANCNFKTLSKYFKRPFAKMEFIDLRHNPWVCDSSLKWFNNLEGSEKPAELRLIECLAVER